MNEQLVLFSSEDPNESRTPMSQLLTTNFWKLALERAVKTSAQTAVSLIGADAVDVLSLDWSQLASVSAGAAFLSVLTSIGSARVGEEGDPSLV